MAKTFSVAVEITGRVASSLGAAATAAENRIKRLSGVFKEQAAAAKSAAAQAAESYKGIAKLAAAGGVVFSVKHAFEGGEELAHELSQLRSAGRTAAEVADGLREANASIRELPTATLSNSIKILNETTGAYGDFKHAVENLKFNAKLGDVLKNALGIDDPAHELGSLVKALEIRGAAGNPERYKAEAGKLAQAMVFYGGRLKSDDLYTFASNAATGVKQLNERFLSRVAPALIQEQGGDKVGTGLTAFRTIISGRKISDMAQAKAWQDLGLLNSKDIITNKKTGEIKGWKDGAIKGTDLAYADPLEFMEKVILPRLQAKGVDINDNVKLGQALNTLFKNTKANAFATMISTLQDRMRLHKDEALMNGVLKLDDIYDSSMLNDPKMAEMAIKSAMTNIGQALTLPLMKPFAEMMISVARSINHLSAALIEHPEVASLIAKIGAALLTWQVIRFANLVLGVGAMARVLGNLSLAVPLDLAARLIATSRAVAAFSLAQLRGIVAGTMALYAVGGRAAVLEAAGASLAGFGRAVLLFPLTALRAVVAGMWALVANPVGLVLAGIVAALTALGVWVYNNWGGIVGFFQAFGASFMKALGPGAASAISTVVGWLGKAWTFISNLLGPIDATGQKWKAWGEWAGHAVGSAVNAILGLPAVFADVAKRSFDALVNFDWTAAGRYIVESIGRGIDGLAAMPFKWALRKLGVNPDAGSMPKLGSAAPLQARALGGPVTRGVPYLVGERGPEIFVPERSGVIETNGALNALAKAGGTTKNRGALGVGVDAEQIDAAAGKARAAGAAIRGLDTAVMPIVFTGSLDEAVRRATKLDALITKIKASQIQVASLGDLRGMGGAGAAGEGDFGGGGSAYHAGRRGLAERMNGGGSGGVPFHGAAAVGGWWTKERIEHGIERLMKEAHLSRAGAEGLISRWATVEAAGGPGSVNRSSGAAGIGQWLGSRKRGFTEDYDSQLGHAVDELNSTEKRAGDALRTARNAREGAVGASMYERAEGYDPRTGTDNFTEVGNAHLLASAAKAAATVNDRGAGTPLEAAAAKAGKGASFPGHISGTLSIDGDSFKFGSGGVRGSSSIPFGDYPIALNAPGAWGKLHGAMGLNNNQIWDKALGRMRQGILMHVGHSTNLITEGCLAFEAAQFPKLKAKVAAMLRREGHAYLHVGKDGASITAEATPAEKAAQAATPKTKLAGARAMGGAVGRGLSYLVGERGPEIFTPGANGQISTNGVLGKLADVGHAVTDGTGERIAPTPERVAKARPDAAPAGARQGGNFHAGNHTWNVYGASDPGAVQSQVEDCFHQMIRQYESLQSGLLSD